MSTADDEPWRLRLCVEDDAGRTMPLERWLISIQTELDRLKATIEQLSIQSRNIVQELSALGSGLAESHRSAQGFRGAAADLHQRMDELDRRLNNILAKVEENLGGGQTEQAMRHHDYVDEYVALVEQKITGLAREIVPDSHPDAAREKARFVAEVCTRLFKEPEVLEQQLIDDLSAQTAAPDGAVQRMRDICTGARALRAKIAHGRPQRWEFGGETGVPIDGQWREPWAGANDDGIVEFVVTPAYFVDTGTVLQKQKVFTCSAGPAPGAGPAGGQEAED